MAPGRKTGGRQKGTPNKISSQKKLAFLATFGRLEGDLERWIKETAEGFQTVHFLTDGTAIPYLEKNPGKAADILIRMAEFHFPRIARSEITGQDGGPVEFVIRDIAKEK